MDFKNWDLFRKTISDYPYIDSLNLFILDLLSDSNILELYLFGSIIENNYDFESDIDIIVILAKSKTFKEELQKLRGKITYKDFMHVFPYSKGEFNYYKNQQNHFLKLVRVLRLK